MPTVSASRDFDSAPDQVWAVISDFSRYGEWNKAHTGFPDGAPAAEAGASFKEKVTIMGMPGEATWTFEEISAPNKFVLSGAGPMGITLGATLELADNGSGGTTATMSSSFDGGPLAGPMGAAVGKAAEKTAGESLDALAGLL